ncbi:FAD-binding oxidoreductase [Microbacterium esteraromaticum]|uniref:FAD-binding oxidoreductase n=1 Tax=Microbacterium esteraromaticum TaxID=57043 RepID=A0A7D7W9H6_9MICO|nr:FAD-binding oxidoreductase [Microbacterium esteraromaticum]QMU95917.1 FAD-binding oxidoreductase [Microbacterium esteraromaticum]
MNGSQSGADVIIVGAGIVGVTAAYDLAAEGHSVRLIDKGPVSDLQSSRNWGFIRRQGCDISEMPLAAMSSKIWDDIRDDIGASSTVVKSGLVYLSPDQENLDKYRGWMRETRADQAFGTELLSPEDVRSLLPSLTGEWAGGLMTPTDGHADPGVATREIAAAAARRGVTIETGVTVTGIRVSAGRVTGVDTTAGPRHAARVIVAAGAWSGRLTRPLGVKIPVRWIRATAARTNPVAHVTDLAVHVPSVGFSQTSDGSVIFGSAAWSDYDLAIDTLGDLRLFLPNFFRNRKMIQLHLNEVAFQDLGRRLTGATRGAALFDWRRMDDPPANRRKIEMAHRNLMSLVPEWRGSRIARMWGGTVDVTPDALPVISAVPRIEGLILATGLSSHGFGIGPGVAKVAAELATDRAPSIDIADFRVSRFDEGPIQAHAHL